MASRSSERARLPASPGFGERLAGQLDHFHVLHALIVADQPAVDAGLARALDASLPERFELTLFQEIPTPPTEAAARAAAELFSLLRCDGIIVVGGAAPQTLAPLVCFLALHNGPLSRHVSANGEILRLPVVLPPLLSVRAGGGVTTVDPATIDLDGSLLELGDGRRVRVEPDGQSPGATVPLDAA